MAAEERHPVAVAQAWSQAAAPRVAAAFGSEVVGDARAYSEIRLLGVVGVHVEVRFAADADALGREVKNPGSEKQIPPFDGRVFRRRALDIVVKPELAGHEIAPRVNGPGLSLRRGDEDGCGDEQRRDNGSDVHRSSFVIGPFRPYTGTTL